MSGFWKSFALFGRNSCKGGGVITPTVNQKGCIICTQILLYTETCVNTTVTSKHIYVLNSKFQSFPFPISCETNIYSALVKTVSITFIKPCSTAPNIDHTLLSPGPNQARSETPGGRSDIL